MSAARICGKQIFLVVDDQREIGELLEDLIGSYGGECESVTDGFEAVQRVRDKQYAGAFIDIQMPEMNGVSTARVLKILDKDLKLVMMTAGPARPAEIRQRGVEMFDFLTKPFDVNQLKVIIDKLSEPTES